MGLGLIGFYITVKNKKHVETVIDLLKSTFRKWYKTVDATEEAEFSNMITFVLRRTVSGERVFKIKKEIQEWKLVNRIFDDIDDKTIFKLTKKYCSVFTILPKNRKKERAVQDQLFSYLEAQFGNHDVKYEKVHPSGKRPDIVVRKKICIEIKALKTKGEEQRIFGQVDEYREIEYKVIALLVAGRKYTVEKLRHVKRRLLRLFTMTVIIR